MGVFYLKKCDFFELMINIDKKMKMVDISLSTGSVWLVAYNGNRTRAHIIYCICSGSYKSDMMRNLCAIVIDSVVSRLPETYRKDELDDE